MDASHTTRSTDEQHVQPTKQQETKEAENSETQQKQTILKTATSGDVNAKDTPSLSYFFTSYFCFSARKLHTYIYTYVYIMS